MYKKRPISGAVLVLLLCFGASPAVATSGVDARALNLQMVALSADIERIESRIVESASMLTVAERRLSRFEGLYSAERGITLKQLEHARAEYLRVLNRDNDLRKRLLERRQARLGLLDQILAAQETPSTLHTAGL